MIQLNLLPEVKVIYLRTERNKRLIILVSVIVVAVMLLLNILGFSLTSLQKNQITSIANKVQQESFKFSKFTNLSTILTVQNQITSINAIQNGSPAMYRLSSYLNEIFPVNTTLGSLLGNTS